MGRHHRPRCLMIIMLLICLSGCGPTRLPPPDSQRPPGDIPTPQDAPAEPTFKPDVPPRFMHDERPLQPRLVADPPGVVRPRLEVEQDAGGKHS
jgi:predicted small lipoprotein YifL